LTPKPRSGTVQVHTGGALVASFVYIDNSNVFIEGQHVSAVRHGMAMNIFDAQQQRISDRDYKLDFGRLYEFSGATKDGCAKLFGSRPPPNDSLWAVAKKAGFEVVVFDRSEWTGKEKMVDTAIVTAMVRDAYTKVKKETDETILMAGDSDYTPTIEQLVADGYKVEVVFWDHAGSALKRAATKFTSLNQYLDHLAKT
jgi:hypothetical protein